MVQQAIEGQIMNMAQVLEEQIDDKLHQLDNLNDNDIEKIRAKRLADMKKRQAKKAEWMKNGHGEYNDLPDEKSFFAEMKGEERMICHFYRENWPCKVMDKHLSELTQKHLETKFVKINAEKSPYLTDKLKIWMLPTLALIKNEKVENYLVGFDELGGTDAFPQEWLVNNLVARGMLFDDGEAARKPPTEATSTRNLRTGGYTRQMESDDEDSDFGDE